MYHYDEGAVKPFHWAHIKCWAPGGPFSLKRDLDGAPARLRIRNATGGSRANRLSLGPTDVNRINVQDQVAERGHHDL